MDAEVQGRVAKPFPKKIAVFSLVAFILLMLAIASQVTYTVLKNDNVYKGVYINDIDVAGLSREEITDLLKTRFQDKAKDSEVLFTAKDQSEKISLSDINLSYDIDAAVEKAMEVGRSGNIIGRLSSIVKTSKEPVKIPLTSRYDENKVKSAIDSLYSKTLTPVKEADLSISNDKVILYSGHSGESIEKEKLYTEIDTLIQSASGGKLEVPLVKIPPAKIDVEVIYGKVSQQPVDATAKVENNSVTVVPHVVGRSIEKSSLEAIASELDKTENTEKVLPVVFTQPKVTSAMASANLLKDTLSTFNTQFYTGNQNDANRGVNIRIAVSRINGTVLAPGQVFSFNDVVGPRTEAGGYKTAHTYAGGTIVDDIGGGICQVSTTLYNSVLFSDMNVVERHNHMFTVGYVPFGRDAAVSYGSVDFKFKNSTNWPLKIEGWVTKGNQIFFSLKGTNETPGKTVSINPKTIKTLEPPPVRYVNDPTLLEGTERVDHEAMRGYVVDTYKVIKIDGKVTSEEKIHQSTYKALERLVKKGTKKAPVPPPAQTPPDPPAGTGESVDPPASPV